MLKWNDSTGELKLKTESTTDWVTVRVQPCFPWLNPHCYLSLRDQENKELFFVENPEDLEPTSATALQKALAEALFCFEVRDILKIEEEFELRVWTVLTAQGERVFQTKLTDWPRRLPSGGYLIQDVQGDLFLIKKLGELSPQGTKHFAPFSD